MKLTCVLCHKEYIFDREKVPEGGFRVGCGVCGSKYTVAFPDGWREYLSSAQTGGQDGSAAGEKSPAVEEKYILMADDTAFFRALMSDLLTKQGYKVKTAADGQEALETYNASPGSFRLLLLDLQMPKMSGFGVLEELKRMDGKAPPVIVMTGVHDSHEDIRIVREMGASGFLDKSLDPSVAVERIKMVLAEAESKQ